MRLLVDENLPVALAGLLTGHEVATVLAIGWLGVNASAELKTRGH
jgi:predicted nuclease of predicted toxin-antitoxin system